MNIETVKSIRTFEGMTSYFSHQSKVTKTKMNFSTFVPKSNQVDKAIIWLSGLTCTEDNFMTKAGAQNILADSNIMIICPDTSPRGLSLEKEHDDYDFGSGAGFYLNATTPGYNDHYNMYDYIKLEVIKILKEYFKIKDISIMGHSMGGHGALILGLREKELFNSVSAFSPIVNPVKCPWGQKAFQGYFGDQASKLSKNYDSVEILKMGTKRDDKILIDQGLADEFYEEQLLTENFMTMAKEMGQDCEVRYRKGYGHSYFYISTFLKEHIEYHKEYLG